MHAKGTDSLRIALRRRERIEPGFNPVEHSVEQRFLDERQPRGNEPRAHQEVVEHRRAIDEAQFEGILDDAVDDEAGSVDTFAHEGDGLALGEDVFADPSRRFCCVAQCLREDVGEDAVGLVHRLGEIPGEHQLRAAAGNARTLAQRTVEIRNVVEAVVRDNQVDRSVGKWQVFCGRGVDDDVRDLAPVDLRSDPLEPWHPRIDGMHLAAATEAFRQFDDGESGPAAKVDRGDAASEPHGTEQRETERSRPERQVVDDADEAGVRERRFVEHASCGHRVPPRAVASAARLPPPGAPLRDSLVPQRPRPPFDGGPFSASQA